LRHANYDKFPFVQVEAENRSCVTGWGAIGKRLNDDIRSAGKKIIVIECYQGVNNEELVSNLKTLVKHDLWIDAKDACKDEQEILAMTCPDITGDRIFGYLTRLNVGDFLDKQKIAALQDKMGATDGVIIIYGTGASLVPSKYDLLVYADMARWEIQLRMRKKEVNNIGIHNSDEEFSIQYKRGFFVDWRACDRLKKQLFSRIDYVVDTNKANSPNLVAGEAILKGMELAVKRPFRVVPFFDPGPWGGQWMKEVCDLDRSVVNYAWCFDCVPEENSLLLRFGDTDVEIPSINVVFYQTDALLGPKVHSRFGDEFPIRFDFLDTIKGGNLSLQVHPLTEYIQEKFGMHYTQDESYYFLDVDEAANPIVFLGVQDDVDAGAMIEDLLAAQRGEKLFDDEKFVKQWPVKKHDHVSIPAGTVHCSGTGGMVLEISATPYIFTFKLWDWGRLGMDGKPRPINIEHGKNVIQWGRTASWVKEHALNLVEPLGSGEGWREERTGLNELEFIETRRHWFTGKVTHNTDGIVNVINLVEGREAIIESPAGAFEPYVVHYAETFIIPAAVGEYTIRPYGESEGKECGTLKAYVRI
jgi:mannose-6-phosphate isomerase class I